MSITLKASDIRELISRALGPLKEKTYYNYTITVKRNDGIDNSRTEVKISGFKTPAILLTNGRTDEFNACFCDVLRVNLDGWKEENGAIVRENLNVEEYGQYTTVEYMNKIGEFENNIATIDTSELDYGVRTFNLLFN